MVPFRWLLCAVQMGLSVAFRLFFFTEFVSKGYEQFTNSSPNTVNTHCEFPNICQVRPKFSQMQSLASSWQPFKVLISLRQQLLRFLSSKRHWNMLPREVVDVPPLQEKNSNRNKEPSKPFVWLSRQEKKERMGEYDLFGPSGISLCYGFVQNRVNFLHRCSYDAVFRTFVKNNVHNTLTF